MYNGIGLDTVRGSGTNGYVQRNLSAIRKHTDRVDYKCEDELKKLETEFNKRPNQDILAHGRKRQVEVKCMEMQELMEEQGYSQEEIDTKVSQFRKLLLEKESVSDSITVLKDDYGRPLATETHQIALATEEKNARWREAFGIEAREDEKRGFGEEMEKRWDKEEIVQAVIREEQTKKKDKNKKHRNGSEDRDERRKHRRGQSEEREKKKHRRDQSEEKEDKRKHRRGDSEEREKKKHRRDQSEEKEDKKKHRRGDSEEREKKKNRRDQSEEKEDRRKHHRDNSEERENKKHQRDQPEEIKDKRKHHRSNSEEREQKKHRKRRSPSPESPPRKERHRRSKSPRSPAKNRRHDDSPKRSHRRSVVSPESSHKSRKKR